MFYEIRVFEERQIFEVYAIKEVGRRTKRSLVFTSDGYHSMKYLERKLGDRHRPLLLKAERIAGNMLGLLFDAEGNLVPMPGAGSKQDDSFGSLVITRRSLTSDTDESDWEEFVPSCWLEGLLPGVFLEKNGLQFWKTGIIVNYLVN